MKKFKCWFNRKTIGIALAVAVGCVLWSGQRAVAQLEMNNGIKGSPDAQHSYFGTSAAPAATFWALPGSLFSLVNTTLASSAIYIQTNAWNTNGVLVLSNYVSYCVTNCNATNAVYTNEFVGTYYTQTYSKASWVQVK